MRAYGKKGESQLRANNHNVYLLYYHLVLVTKYRRRLINRDIAEDLLPIIRSVTAENGAIVKEAGYEEDHIHLLIESKPQVNMADLVKKVKGKSSYLIRQKRPEINKGKAFWNRSYCLLTTGGAPIDIIKKYIENQGQKRPANR